MDTKILEKIGLTRNEGLVYLALLKTGTSKTGEILKESHLNSGKIYEILESLKLKGLVSESIINNVRNFTCAPPSEILEYLGKRKEEVEEDEQTVRSVLPDLERLRKTKIKAVKSITYIGLRGIKTAANEALNSMDSNEDILAMGVTELKDKNFNDFWKRWSDKRIRKKIIAKHIFSEKSSYYEEFRKMKHTESKVLTGLTPVTVDIFGNDKILILNYEEPVSCILIYDRNTATSFRHFFEQLWKLSKN